MRGSRKFCQRGSNFANVVLVDEGREDSNTTFSRPSSARQRTPLNGVPLAYRWWPNIECWLGSFVIFRGSGPVFLRNPIFFVIFSGGGGGGGGGHLVPPHDPRKTT